MSKHSATKTLTAILSVATIGAGLWLGMGTVRAEEKGKDKNVTEDQILRALVPEKKPLTRGLSVGPQTQTDPAATAAETKFVQTIRGRNTRSLSVTERTKTTPQEKLKISIFPKPSIRRFSQSTTSTSRSSNLLRSRCILSFKPYNSYRISRGEDRQ